MRVVLVCHNNPEHHHCKNTAKLLPLVADRGLQATAFYVKAFPGKANPDSEIREKVKKYVLKGDQQQSKFSTIILASLQDSDQESEEVIKVRTFLLPESYSFGQTW